MKTKKNMATKKKQTNTKKKTNFNYKIFKWTFCCKHFGLQIENLEHTCYDALLYLQNKNKPEDEEENTKKKNWLLLIQNAFVVRVLLSFLPMI